MASSSFSAILSSTNCVIKSNRSHFIFLSFIFVFPFSVALIVCLTLSFYIAPLACLLFLLATGTIAYSVSEVIHGRHITVMESVKSLHISFFPLLATALMVMPVICFGVFTFFKILGLGYGSNLFVAVLQGVILFVVVYITMSLQVHSSLAFVIVVVESKWGFESLRRSKYLLQEIRSTGFALLFTFGIIMWPMIWLNHISSYTTFTNFWKHLDLILRVICGSLFITMYMSHYCASTMVLYMYCKAQHGELPSEIAKEFTGDYVSLPVDGMEPHQDACMAEP